MKSPKGPSSKRGCLSFTEEKGSQKKPWKKKTPSLVPFDKHELGPPVERLEYGYPFSVVYFSRGTLPQKKRKKGTEGPREHTIGESSHSRSVFKQCLPPCRGLSTPFLCLDCQWEIREVRKYGCAFYFDFFRGRDPQISGVPFDYPLKPQKKKKKKKRYRASKKVEPPM